MNEEVMAVYSMGTEGLELLGFKYENGEDYMVYRESWGDKVRHESKIRYNDKGAYFKFCGLRVYLSECFRIWG